MSWSTHMKCHRIFINRSYYFLSWNYRNTIICILFLLTVDWILKPLTVSIINIFLKNGCFTLVFCYICCKINLLMKLIVRSPIFPKNTLSLSPPDIHSWPDRYWGIGYLADVGKLILCNIQKKEFKCKRLTIFIITIVGFLQNSKVTNIDEYLDNTDFPCIQAIRLPNPAISMENYKRAIDGFLVFQETKGSNERTYIVDSRLFRNDFCDPPFKDLFRGKNKSTSRDELYDLLKPKIDSARNASISKVVDNGGIVSSFFSMARTKSVNSTPTKPMNKPQPTPPPKSTPKKRKEGEKAQEEPPRKKIQVDEPSSPILMDTPQPPPSSPQKTARRASQEVPEPIESESSDEMIDDDDVDDDDDINDFIVKSPPPVKSKSQPIRKIETPKIKKKIPSSQAKNEETTPIRPSKKSKAVQRLDSQIVAKHEGARKRKSVKQESPAIDKNQILERLNQFNCLGSFEVKPSRLSEPSDQVKIREADPAFVELLMQSIRQNYLADVPPLLVAVDIDEETLSLPTEEIFNTILLDKRFIWYTIGGNHSRTAFARLLEETGQEIYDRPRLVKVFYNLKVEEAQLLGSEHNRNNDLR
jgi:hypothetical protein